MSEGPLKTLKVVELCEFVAGPWCTRLLADFGAEVIKVERPGTGDVARRRGPFPKDLPNPEASGTFLYLNTGKLGVTADLESADGREIFRKLVADADILVEDRAPGEMKRLGLDYETLKKLNPRLIMTSITPFGQTGPYKDYKAQHLNLYHASGQGYLLPMWSPTLDRAPVRGPGFVGEYDGGMSAVIATLGALFWRDSGGTGQHIDIAKQQAMLHLDRSQLRRYVDAGVSPNRTGKGRLLESLLPCKDGNYIVVVLSSQEQWEGLWKAMGSPEWGGKPPFNTQAGLSDNYPELRERLIAWSKQNYPEEIFQAIQENKSACAPVQTAEQFYKSRHVAERGYLTEIDHPVAGRFKYPGLPFKFSNLPAEARQPAPLLGQHNEQVLGERLKYSREELVKLKQAGVI